MNELTLESAADVIDLARSIHKEDRYGDKLYAYHLYEVYRTACFTFGMAWGQSHHTLIYLHDAIEDHPECLEQLEQRFSAGLIRDLQSLNKNNFSSREEYLKHLVERGGDVLKVKICDTIANLKENIKDLNFKGTAKYAKQLAYLAEGLHEEQTHQ